MWLSARASTSRLVASAIRPSGRPSGSRTMAVLQQVITPEAPAAESVIAQMPPNASDGRNAADDLTQIPTSAGEMGMVGSEKIEAVEKAVAAAGAAEKKGKGKNGVKTGKAGGQPQYRSIMPKGGPEKFVHELANKPLTANRWAQTPEALLEMIGRNATKHLGSKATSWEALTKVYREGTAPLKEAGVSVKDRKYYFACFTRYLRGEKPTTFIRRPRPPKQFRRWGGKVQKGVRIFDQQGRRVHKTG